jgi:hypothetical protein
VDFCVEHGGKWCYAGWPVELVEAYLQEMARRRAMIWTRNEFGNVAGVGVFWRCWEWELRQAQAEGKHAVDAATFDVQGDSVFFADWVCRDRRVMAELLRGAEMMWPAYRELKWWTFRRGELKRLDGSRLGKGLDPRRLEDRRWRISGEVRSAKWEVRNGKERYWTYGIDQHTNAEPGLGV